MMPLTGSLGETHYRRDRTNNKGDERRPNGEPGCGERVTFPQASLPLDDVLHLLEAILVQGIRDVAVFWLHRSARPANWPAHLEAAALEPALGAP
jgi:hypothetical protein